MSVLLENTILYMYVCIARNLKFLQNYIQDLSVIFFRSLPSEDINNVISHFFTVVMCANGQFVYMYCTYEFLFSCVKINVSLSCCARL